VSELADRYDARHPGIDISSAQKEERQERAEFREERRTLQRTTRNRGIIVPDLPWLRGADKEKAS
jgi:hypothetical protein